MSNQNSKFKTVVSGLLENSDDLRNSRYFMRRGLLRTINAKLKDESLIKDGIDYKFLTSFIEFDFSNNEAPVIVSLYFTNSDELRKEYKRTRSVILLENYTKATVCIKSNHALSELFTGINIEF